jgi:hypothetical protein
MVYAYTPFKNLKENVIENRVLSNMQLYLKYGNYGNYNIKIINKIYKYKSYNE